MDKKQVIGRYIIEIHDDGTISGREITFNKIASSLNELDNAICTDSISSRMLQILLVLHYVVERYLEHLHTGRLFVLRKVIYEAVRKVADKLNVTVQSVNCKITKEIGLNMNEFHILVFSYLKTLTGHGEIYSETDDIELKRLLMLKITSRKKGASDYIALEKFFRNPEIDIVISESSVRNIQSSKERSDKRLATMNKKSIA